MILINILIWKLSGWPTMTSCYIIKHICPPSHHWSYRNASKVLKFMCASISRYKRKMGVMGKSDSTHTYIQKLNPALDRWY